MKHSDRVPWQGDDPVSRLLAEARREAQVLVPPDGRNTVAAMVAEAGSPHPAPIPSQASRRGLRLAGRISVVTAAAAMLTGGGLAMAGELPSTLQQTVHDGAQHVGVHLPDPHHHPHHPGHLPPSHAVPTPTSAHHDHPPAPHASATLVPPPHHPSVAPSHPAVTPSTSPHQAEPSQSPSPLHR